MSHNTPLGSTRDIKSSASNSKSPSWPQKDCFSVLCGHSSGRWSVGYGRLLTAVCDCVCQYPLHLSWLSCRQATGQDIGYLRLLLQSACKLPTWPDKRPVCVNRLMLSCVPLLCQAIIGTCRPVEQVQDRLNGRILLRMPRLYRICSAEGREEEEEEEEKKEGGGWGEWVAGEGG